MDKARMAAAKALIKVEQKGGYSNLSLDTLLSQSGLPRRDRAFAAALFYGVLERMLTLDGVIGAHSKTPLEKLTVQVRVALQMGLYQMLYMDSVPDSAAVNESVNLIKALGLSKASGFVNGVLRSVLRAEKKLPLPDEESDLPEHLSLRYSCPRWLVERWLKSYGPARCRGILEASLGRPPLYIRVNTVKTDMPSLISRLEAEGVQARPVQGVENALALAGTGEMGSLPAFQEGLFHVQDLASQLCARAMAPGPGERVYDLCSAPGGKAFTMAQLMENRGELLAFDIHKHKINLIAEGAQRLGLDCIKSALGDASRFREDLPAADRVLCDVPCSGLGIIRRKPEIKYKEEQSLLGLPSIQYKILENAAKYVKVGGRLLYSTCTLCREENEKNTERFLQEHPEFGPCALPACFDRLFPPRESAHQVTIFPEDMGSDGFFIAVFTKLR